MFWNSICNTVSIFLLSAIPQLIVAIVIAYLLDQGLRAKTFWRMSVLLPYVVTPVAVALIFSSIFNEADGLANNLLNLVGIPDQAWKHDTFLSHIAIATMVNWRWTGLQRPHPARRDAGRAARPLRVGRDRRRRRRPPLLLDHDPEIRPTLIFVIITATIGGLQIFTEPKLFDAVERRRHRRIRPAVPDHRAVHVGARVLPPRLRRGRRGGLAAVPASSS